LSVVGVFEFILFIYGVLLNGNEALEPEKKKEKPNIQTARSCVPLTPLEIKGAEFPSQWHNLA